MGGSDAAEEPGFGDVAYPRDQIRGMLLSGASSQARPVEVHVYYTQEGSYQRGPDKSRTLPQTNMEPEKEPLKRTVVHRGPLLRFHVSLAECIYTYHIRLSHQLTGRIALL